MYWRAFKQNTADRTLSPGFPGCTVHQVLKRRRIAVARLRPEKTVVFRTPNISLVGVTQACGRCDKRVEDGLEVEGRAGNQLQHFGSSRLLLQRFGKIVGALTKLVEQPRILDGDDGLGREVLH